jgi:hypothetical protein
VLFADLKGSMELLADRDPEDARKLWHRLLSSCGVPRPSLAGYVAGWGPRPGQPLPEGASVGYALNGSMLPT